jgi:hypothetical protein
MAISLLHKVVMGKISAHCPFQHTLLILATMPYVFLSFLFLAALTLQAQGTPSLLNNPLGDPFSQGFHVQEECQLTTRHPLVVFNR